MLKKISQLLIVSLLIQLVALTSYSQAEPGPVSSTTTTVITTSSYTLVTGEEVVLTAMVSPLTPGPGLPTGTVTFTLPDETIETANLDESTGLATITTTSLITGEISATYNGDEFHDASTNSISVIVMEASTITTITAMPDPSVFGESVLLSAVVTTNAPGSGIPEGTVTFAIPGGGGVE